LRRICPRVDHERTPRKLAHFWRMSVASLSAPVDISTGTSNVPKRPEKPPLNFCVRSRNFGRGIAI
jgi:hypothetical protein